MLKDQIREAVAKAPQVARSPWAWLAFLSALIASDPIKGVLLSNKSLAVAALEVFANAQALSASPWFRLAMVPITVFLFAMACKSVADKEEASRQQDAALRVSAIQPVQKIVNLFLDNQQIMLREWQLRLAREAVAKTRASVASLREAAVAHTSRLAGTGLNIHVVEALNLILEIEKDFTDAQAIAEEIHLLHPQPHFTLVPTGGGPGIMAQTRIFDPDMNRPFLDQNDTNCDMLEERMRLIAGRLKAKRMKWEIATQEYRPAAPNSHTL